MTRNVTQNTRPSFRFLGGSGDETSSSSSSSLSSSLSSSSSSEFGVRDGGHLVLRTCATAVCIALVRWELGFL